MSTEQQVTPLLQDHRALGARIVPFAGFQMPLQYSGILDEHHAVRRAVGLFDVSHMGEVWFHGPGARDAINQLICNDLARLRDGQCLYTPIMYPDGGIVDDCIVYRCAAETFFIVVNAANHDKDLAWFREHAAQHCTIEDRSAATALVALQGPNAVPLWRDLAGDAAAQLQPFTFCEAAAPVPCTVSRTGYTGEDGYEIFCAAEHASQLWQILLERGARWGIKPCGLGARDTLRLEARLPLYGQDIDETTSPLEAGLGWTVKLDKAAFIGRDPLRRQREQGVSRKLVSLVLRARGIARHGHAIYRAVQADAAPEPIGIVTSGTMSPTLNQAIALGYVPTSCSSKATHLAIDVRGKRIPAEVITGPFYKRPTKE